MTQHRLGEARGLCRKGCDHLGRTFGQRAPEGVELDLSDQVHAAGHGAQSVGQAFLFPSIGLALLGIEKIQRRDEVFVKPVFAIGGTTLHVLVLVLALRRDMHMGA